MGTLANRNPHYQKIPKLPSGVFYFEELDPSKVFFENENSQSLSDDALAGFETNYGGGIVGRNFYRGKNCGSVLAVNDGGIC